MAARRQQRWTVAVLMITMLGVGACGEDNGGSSTTGPTSAAAPPPAPPPSPTQGINVTGTYRGSVAANTGSFGGTLTLTQTGSSVSGTISFDSGSGGAVTGTLSGTTLTMNVAGCPNTATVASDSNTITITSFTCPDGTTGTGVFTRV